LALVRPQPPEHPPATALTDAQVGESIRKGVDWLVDEFAGSRLKRGDQTDPETFAGRDALAVYALLHAGQAINDSRLSPQSDFVKGLIDRMKDFPMNGNRATYSRALRLNALAVYARPEDRVQIEQDAQYLIKSSMKGAFTYELLAENNRPQQGGWDNSNSQYGALGLWAAAEAGYRVPNVFWSDVERHWTENQTHTGAWGYNPGAQNGNLALTAGGITSLFVARDQMLANASELTPHQGAPRAIERGIEWLDEADNSIRLDGGHLGYSLYGLERAGLASGYKFFGNHDWYLELANKVIGMQKPDGSWEGGDGEQVETSFALLFLSRGRHPVLISKLEFDGAWANYARDLANLTRWAGKMLERPLNWQVVDIKRSWQEWTDSAVLYIATDKPPELTDSQIEKLRSFAEAGGVIFTHADKNSQATNEFVNGLAKRLFPQYPLQPLPKDHMVYSALFPMKENQRPDLLGASNGVRLLLVHSPTDLAKAWQRRLDRTQKAPFEMGVNVAIYASGRRELRNRVESIFIPEPLDKPAYNVPIARLKYKGNWDPEPGAWRRFARQVEVETRIHLDVSPIDTYNLNIANAPLAVLTGVGTFAPDQVEVNAIREFVNKGGVLFIDSCGGGKEFASNVRTQLLDKISPSRAPEPLPGNHIIIQGGDPGMQKAAPLRTRAYTTEALAGANPPPLQYIPIGDGMVIISQMDVISGLLGTSTWGIIGYQPTVSQAIMRNVVMYSLKLPPR
jgi:hypothetical protein